METIIVRNNVHYVAYSTRDRELLQYAHAVRIFRIPWISSRFLSDVSLDCPRLPLSY